MKVVVTGAHGKVGRAAMFERSGPLTVDGFPGSGADFLEELKQHVLRGSTIVASPHKMWGPESNDLALQLRKQNVSQIVLAGMAANLCVESHLRHLLEEGFEVAVVRDATASALRHGHQNRGSSPRRRHHGRQDVSARYCDPSVNQGKCTRKN